MQAYNDWHIESWCGAYPGRFIPLSIPMMWDVDKMSAEVRRVADKGCFAVTFSENPVHLGYPSIHSGHWDKFFATCEELGTVVNVHIGSSSKMVITADDAPMDVLITLSPINIVQAAADFVWSTVPVKFPKLKYALSEGGIGWIPYFRERIDYTYDRHRYWTGMDRGDRMPSRIMDEQVICCWIDDPVGVDMRHKMNVDMICWECDYPHSDSSWPQSPEAVWKQMQASQCSDEDIDKITHANAMRLYKYDPFSVLGKENCNVGALRAQAEGWDVSIVAAGHQGLGHGCDRPPQLRQSGPLAARLAADAGQVAQARHEPARAQAAQRPFLVGVDDHRVARLPVDDERDDAVVARGGARHCALAAVDRERLVVGHAVIMPGA